jgi:3-oxoacyl-[acyl-carrier protein] reductase
MHTFARYDFSDRHAIVTGGGAGIGLEIVERLLASGAHVSVWDQNPDALDQLITRHPGKLHAVNVDVSDEHSVQRAFASTLQFRPLVHLLVNSAGVTGPNATVAEYSLHDWDRVFAVNTRGTFLACREVVRHMLLSHDGKGYGRIVNIASVAGKEGNPNASAYSASKAAVIALTKSLGKELALTGIRVNCVTPAAVRTGLFDQMSQEHIDFMLSKIPMNRFGLTEEIARMVLWLSSDDCSFSTGAAFDLSGGRATY